MQPPAHVVILAHEALDLGANAFARTCSWGDNTHIDIFETPPELESRLAAAGYERSCFREKHWRWCAGLMPDDHPTTPPPP